VNLLFLVEGGKTEPKVYKAWLSHLFSQINFVDRPEDMTTNSCRIIAGNGYPNMVSAPKILGGRSRLEECLLDIKKYNNIDHFFFCVDSEDDPYQTRFDEIHSKLEDFKTKLGIDQTQNTEFHIIIQNCCFETWALGNADIPAQYSAKGNSDFFSVFQPYYDVLTNDPELMGVHLNILQNPDFTRNISSNICENLACFIKKKDLKPLKIRHILKL
jgi:hypothetical protein